MNQDPSTPDRPGHRREGSGVCQSLSGSGDFGRFGFAEGGGSDGGSGGQSGMHLYRIQVCRYSFHMCHSLRLMIGGAIYRR